MSGADEHAPKRCASCGRLFDWRRNWAKNWESVRYCSDACRRSKPGARDKALERAIIELLGVRANGASICPSEAARRVEPEDWRGLMEPARRAAGRLVGAGQVEVTQGGRVVEISEAKGPIRIRRGDGFPTIASTIKT